MGRIEDTCTVLGKACLQSVLDAGVLVPAQFYIGAPFGPSLTKILTQSQYAVTVFPLPGGRRLPPRGYSHVSTFIIAPTVVATVTNGINIDLNLTGTPGVYNFNVVFDHPVLGTQFIYYRSTLADTLTTIASNIVTLLNAVGSPLFSLSNASNIAITGVSNVRCNIGTIGTYSQFQSRFEQRIQVSTWTPNAFQDTNNPTVDTPLSLRSVLCDAIISAVGTDMNQWYTLPSGSALRLRLSALPAYVDESQSDYNLYEAHMIFLAEYVIETTSQGTQVGVIEDQTTISTFTPILFIGG